MLLELIQAQDLEVVLVCAAGEASPSSSCTAHPARVSSSAMEAPTMPLPTTSTERRAGHSAPSIRRSRPSCAQPRGVSDSCPPPHAGAARWAHQAAQQRLQRAVFTLSPRWGGGQAEAGGGRSGGGSGGEDAARAAAARGAERHAGGAGDK